jgi:hypothetical protein
MHTIADFNFSLHIPCLNGILVQKTTHSADYPHYWKMHLDYPMMVPHAFFINVYINIHPMLKFNFTQCHITKGEANVVPHASRNIHKLLIPPNVIDPETELHPMLFDKKTESHPMSNKKLLHPMYITNKQDPT